MVMRSCLIKPKLMFAGIILRKNNIPPSANLSHHILRLFGKPGLNIQDGMENSIIIDKIAESNSLYQKWSPKLFKFAAQCRADQPTAPEISLSDSDRAKQHIYESKIKNAERLPQKLTRNKVIVCRMPLIAISVAQRLWPGEDDNTVILTPEEKSKWADIYSHPKDTFWWFIHYW